MPANDQDLILFKHLFTSHPDFALFDKDFDEFSSISLSTLKLRNDLMPLILAVACGEYGFRSAQHAAGVHPEAFSRLLKKADIRLLIAYNDPLTIAFYNASASVAKCFFEHYIFLNSNDERVLSAIVTAIYAVKQRPNDNHKAAILRFLEENRSVLIEGEKIGTLLDMSSEQLKQHKSFNSLISVTRTVDQISAEHIINEMGGSLPYVAPEMNPIIAQVFPTYELYRHPKRNFSEECCYRFRNSKKNTGTYEDFVRSLEKRIFKQDDDFVNHTMVYFPKITACLLRNIREETTGQPLLVYAANKGLSSPTNPDGIRKENLDEFTRMLKDDMTVPNNPLDPLMRACQTGNQEMFIYFFEKYVGYRNLRAQARTDIHGKEFVLNEYIEKAILYFAKNEQASNRDAILQYLWNFDGIGVLTGSTTAISVKDFLIQHDCKVTDLHAKVTI